MRTLDTISSNDLAAKMRDVVDQVRQGRPTLVHTSGEDQIVLLDALDYRLLDAAAGWALRPASATEDSPMEERAVRSYLDERISLGKAAELLSISRFDLQNRFLRLDIPLRQGPKDEAEALAEVETARELASDAS